MNLHYHYHQLTQAERKFVDEVMADTWPLARSNDIKLSGDDRAERAADALAKWVIESREE